MKGFIGYTSVVIVSGILCATLDHYNYIVNSSFYWFVGFVSGIAATELLNKG